MSMVLRPQRIYIFLHFTIPKMLIFTINYNIFISQVTVDKVLIDTGSSSNMPSRNVHCYVIFVSVYVFSRPLSKYCMNYDVHT